MKRILMTGMSGTGKSSVIETLRARGFTAIDADYDDWSELASVNGESEWIWSEERMRNLLCQPLTHSLFVAGCACNQGKFYQFFNHVILLSAPLETILERVAARSNNPYGKSEQERAEICHNYREIEPLLRKRADIEIDTSRMGVNEIADFLSELAVK